MTFAILCESGKIPVAKAHLSRSTLAANLCDIFQRANISPNDGNIFSNPLQKFKIGIYLRFVPFNSVISMHIDIKHLCHHVYYGSGPTNTALTNNQAF